MHFLTRPLIALLASLALLISACGGSASPEAPAPSTSSSNAISEADAITNAEAAAADEGLVAQGLTVNPALLFGEWQVSFEPADAQSLTGGFLVVLDAQTGDLLDVVIYQ